MSKPWRAADQVRRVLRALTDCTFVDLTTNVMRIDVDEGPGLLGILGCTACMVLMRVPDPRHKNPGR